MTETESLLYEVLRKHEYETFFGFIRKNPALLEHRVCTDMTPLCFVAGSQRPDIVKQLLELGANVDPDFPSGKIRTPLIMACFGGDVESVRLLIDAGADVNRVDDLKFSPLKWSELNRDHELIAALLINAGANRQSK